MPARRTCAVCNFQADDLLLLRQHALKIHPKVKFTNILKRKYIEDALYIYMDQQNAQPLEWLDDEPAKCMELLRAFGRRDPINQIDVFNVYRGLICSKNHEETCECHRCGWCQVFEECTYDDVLAKNAWDESLPSPPKSKHYEDYLLKRHYSGDDDYDNLATGEEIKDTFTGVFNAENE